MAYNSNELLRGTDGRVYIDGELMGYVESFEAKQTFDKEDLLVNGDYGTKHVMKSYSIAGTYTGFKTNSKFQRMYAGTAKTGTIPAMTITAKNANPATSEKEIVRLIGVLPDEIMLSSFTNGEIIKEEIPFTADDYEYTDMI